MSRSLSPQGLQPGGRRHGRPSPFSRCPPTGPGGEWGALQQEGSEGAAVAALLWRLCFSSSHVNLRSLGQMDKRPLYPGCHLLCSGGGRENGLQSWGAWHQDTRLFFPSHRLRVSGSQDPAGASKAVGWHLQPASGAAAAQGGPFHCRARGGAQSWGRGSTWGRRALGWPQGCGLGQLGLCNQVAEAGKLKQQTFASCSLVSGSRRWRCPQGRVW